MYGHLRAKAQDGGALHKAAWGVLVERETLDTVEIAGAPRALANNIGADLRHTHGARRQSRVDRSEFCRFRVEIRKDASRIFGPHDGSFDEVRSFYGVLYNTIDRN